MIGTAWRWLLVLMLVLALAFGAVQARAQTIDDVSLKVQGSDLVARVSFNGSVRVLQQAPVTPAELYRISLELVAADEAVASQSNDESRRVEGVGALPEFTLTYEAARGRRIKQLTVVLRGRADMKVRQGPSSKTIDLVFVGMGGDANAEARANARADTKAGDNRRFALLLQSVPVAQTDRLTPIPNRFDTYEVFDTRSVVDGVTTYDVNLGYFATREQAEAVRRSALDRFPQATVVDLAQRRDAMLQSAAQDAPAPAPAPAPMPVPTDAPQAPIAVAPPAPQPSAPPPVASAAIESRAAELMQSAREAFAGQRYDEAVKGLNQLLLLPPNSMSQEAQELVGVAWERAGDARRARVEYELYLKLFPAGEGSRRVAQRLAALGDASPSIAAAPGAAAGAPSGAAGGAATERSSTKFTGNLAQYYYGGKARSQSLVNIATGIDQSTLTKTTESAVVTSVDLGGRYSSPESETRFVVRGTGSTNFAAESHSRSLLSAAYVDYKRSGNGLALRVGRQSAISGGLLGLFDGASLAYPVGRHWKVELMGGVPANPLVTAPSERLLAAMVEADGLFDHWGGNVYLIDQTTEGIANRRAVGTEVRYSGDTLSLYSLLDYDTLFRAVNAASLQGSFQAPGQTTITVLVDSRKAPSLQMTNALISSGAMSLNALLQMQSLQQVRDAAFATTAQAKQALLSVSRPLSQKWQVAMDLRYSAIGALPAVGNFEATPATGSQYGASLQLVGSNLYSSRDINNVNVSVLTSPTFKGYQVAYSNLTGLRGNDLTLEPSIRWYAQRDTQGSRMYRISPGLRASYRLSARTSVLGEGLLEHSRTESAGSYDTTNSMFFYVGYRYELF